MKVNDEILYEKFSNLIERKINARNKKAVEIGKDAKLIAYMDEEINLLESIELNITEIFKESAKRVVMAHREGFKRGVSAGIMEAKTGRAHPEYMFQGK